MSYSNIKHDLKPEKYKLKEEWDILIPRVCLQNLKRQQWIAWWGKGKSIRSSDSWPLCLLGQSLASSPLSLATVTWKWEQSQHLFTLFSQLSSVASDSAAPWTAARQASLSITNSCPNSLPSSQRCHSTISPSIIPFSSCLQSFPASGSLPVSLFFASCGRSSCCNEDEMRESLKNLKYPLDSKNRLLIIAEPSVVVCLKHFLWVDTYTTNTGFKPCTLPCPPHPLGFFCPTASSIF